MQKPLNLLIGPELFWILCYIIVVVMIRVTHSPVKSMDNVWVSMAYIVPLLLIPLSFMLYFIPAVPHKLLLLRLWVAGLFGFHFVLSRALEAHSEGGPGVGTAYIMGGGFAIFALIGMTIWAVIKF